MSQSDEKGRKRPIISTDYVVWDSASVLIEGLKLNSFEIIVMGELYRRVRKYPEIGYPIALMLPFTASFIINKYDLLTEEKFGEAIASLVEKEIIEQKNIDGVSGFVFNKKIFLTNGRYYSEQGVGR